MHDSLSQNAQLAGARGHHGNLPPMPPNFFASAEISRLRLSRPSQRSQEPSLGSEKLIGIGFAELECSKKLEACRIWVPHKTCRAAVDWCVHCRKSCLRCLSGFIFPIELPFSRTGRYYHYLLTIPRGFRAIPQRHLGMD